MLKPQKNRIWCKSIYHPTDGHQLERSFGESVEPLKPYIFIKPYKIDIPLSFIDLSMLNGLC